VMMMRTNLVLIALTTSAAAFVPTTTRTKKIAPFQATESCTTTTTTSVGESASLPPGVPPSIDLFIPDELGVINTMKENFDVDGLTEAAEGMAAVLQIDPEQVKNVVFLRESQCWDGLLSWKGVKRGADLFIKGLGKFNIVQTYQQLREKKQASFRKTILYNLGIDDDSEGVDVVDEILRADLDKIEFVIQKAMENLSWFVSVPELQGQAYFAVHWQSIDEETRDALAYLLGLPEDNPMRQHLLTNYHRWRNVGRIESIVILAKHAKLRSDGKKYCWYHTAPNETPFRLARKLKAMQNAKEYFEDRFAYLDKLPDKGRICVLRSRLDVRVAGEDLHNCAKDYIDGIVKKSRVLLVLMREKSKKLDAMAMIKMGPSGLYKSYDDIRMTSIVSRMKSPSRCSKTTCLS